MAAGAEVIIAKAGKPMVRLTPIAAAPRPKKPGLLAGKINVPDDFNEAFHQGTFTLTEFDGR